MSTAARALPAYDLGSVRAQFPILGQRVHGKRLAYLDNAATTQKPEAVLSAIDHYYRRDNANVHRAVHALAARATQSYEDARDRIASWFGADRRRVIFTRGTTEAINLVAWRFLRPRLGEGDEILASTLEHHSNLVPWQLVAAEAGARLREVPVRDEGTIDLDALASMWSPHVKMLAVGQVSNALGTENPVGDLVREAHAHGVPVIIDGAQATAHARVDVDALGADFYAVSSHKAYGPTGFGALIGRLDHLEAMEPWHGGGDMIETVSFDGSTWNELPYRFEAGTPDMAGAIGFAAALDWIASSGLDAIAAHERAVLGHARDVLASVPGLRLLGPAAGTAGILSFVMDGAHPQDLATLLDLEGVAIRAGHHCAMPLMHRLGVTGTTRLSLAAYNGTDDIDQLVAALRKARDLLN